MSYCKHPTGSDVINAARCWLGTPWRHCGRSAEGIDCAGLLIVVCQSLGLAYRDVKSYSRRAGGSLETMLDRQMHRLPNTYDVQPGDWWLFWRDDPSLGQHLACVVDGKRELIIHADDASMRVVEATIPATLIEHQMAAYRFKELV